MNSIGSSASSIEFDQLELGDLALRLDVVDLLAQFLPSRGRQCRPAPPPPLKCLQRALDGSETRLVASSIRSSAERIRDIFRNRENLIDIVRRSARIWQCPSRS